MLASTFQYFHQENIHKSIDTILLNLKTFEAILVFIKMLYPLALTMK